MTREALLQNFGYNQMVVNANLDGVSAEEARKRPAAGGNSINWVLGHILVSRNHLHRYLGLDPAWDDPRAAGYERGTKPSEDSSQMAPLGEIQAALNASCEVANARIGKLTDAEMQAACEHVVNAGETSQVGLMLAALQFHEAYHAGQIGILRRVIGKQGVIA